MSPLTTSGVRQLTLADLQRLWPRPQPDADKYSRGVLGVDTGSARYPGAAVLSVLAALNAGPGFIRFVGAAKARPALLTRTPSVTFGLGQVQAWVVGSGWDEVEFNTARMLRACAAGVPLVVDAGALWVMPSTLPSDSLLTPHMGELARLLSVERAEVAAHPLEYAGEAARRFGASVLVKGPAQFCVGADGTAWAAIMGPAWSAQAGSGDVLAGIAGTLLASGVEATLAGALAASLQAVAAASHPGPLPPDRLAQTLPALIGSFDEALARPTLRPSLGEAVSADVATQV
ncbi:MAG: NAD(P)H-hydrate dehydratase [Propionibacteriaceae bacterium]|jgi:NAD(P)H-hydrate repair Nnr-like enzyme with NAD(P)H-hydrate dehydratase domain|nr:NAD(P)H-hydrate dehydratase [Propionibacteriaceae bacterium]